jgi:DNA-binding NarL/FixJ family response regulator
MTNARNHEVSVLLVDDHAAVRSCLRHLLEDAGMHVVGEAADGNEAVRECAHLHPQIVVLDISMPVLNGFEAAREIAKLSPASIIIFLSGHTLKEYAREAFKAGGAAFVTKKNAAHGLVEAIEATLVGEPYIAGQN